MFQKLIQSLPLDQKLLAIGYQLPAIESIEDHLGLAAEIGELISKGALQALICSKDDPESMQSHFAQMLMQATRVRMFQADFISCPSCGRTFFDLQQTTDLIKQKTAHLIGIKEMNLATQFFLMPIGLITVAIPVAPGGIGIGHIAFESLYQLAGLSGGADIFNLFIIVQLGVFLLGGIPYFLYSSEYKIPDTQEEML